MTVDDQMIHRWSHCQGQVCRLRMLAMNDDCLAPSGRVAAEVRDITNTVIAEIEAMSRAVLDGCRRGTGAETFLWVRVARLVLAADRAVDAARGGNFAALRAELQHFDTLTSAIWTVENALYGCDPAFGRVLLKSDIATSVHLSSADRRTGPARRHDPMPLSQGAHDVRRSHVTPDHI
jgi:hypothetical protein